MKSERICIIVNPFSQGGRTRFNYPSYLNNLKNNGLIFDTYHTKTKKHSTDIVKKYLNDYDTFIAIGGDGLLHEIAQVLVKHKDKTLGIAPSGNGNMFASHHWIYNIHDAISSIKKNKKREIDLVKIKFKSDEKTKTVYSHCIFGLGYISDVVRLAVNSFRIFGPKFCYPMSGFLGSMYLDKYKTKLVFDDKKYTIDKLNTIIFLNHGRVGPFKIVENSSDRDGKIEYVIYKNTGRIEAALCVLEAALRTQNFTRNKTVGQAKKIKIKLPSKKELMIDGEMYGCTDLIEAEVIHKSLTVLTNKKRK